jgi:hypothetical protein
MKNPSTKNWCQRIWNLKFCNQLSNLNAGFTNLDGETLVKVIKPPIVHIDISGIMLDLDHVKGLLQVCHSTLLTCFKNNNFEICVPERSNHSRLLLYIADWTKYLFIQWSINSVLLLQHYFFLGVNSTNFPGSCSNRKDIETC